MNFQRKALWVSLAAAALLAGRWQTPAAPTACPAPQASARRLRGRVGPDRTALAGRPPTALDKCRRLARSVAAGKHAPCATRPARPAKTQAITIGPRAVVGWVRQASQTWWFIHSLRRQVRGGICTSGQRGVFIGLPADMPWHATAPAQRVFHHATQPAPCVDATKS